MTNDTKNLDLFDANCMIGPLVEPEEGLPQTVDELLNIMDETEIAEALVYASQSKDYHPAFGNRALLEAIAHVDRLHAMWVVMPSHTGEFPDEEQLVEEMLSQGVRAARMFPGPEGHNISLAEWSAGKLLGALANRAIPLFIDADQLDWDTVHDLCETYPELPLVLTNVGYRLDRFLYPLWQRFDNLYIELSHYFGHRAIETVTDRFGAARLLFGTGLPYYAPSSAVGMLGHAKIREEDMRKIAGDNLRDLLRDPNKTTENVVRSREA